MKELKIQLEKVKTPQELIMPFPAFRYVGLFNKDGKQIYACDYGDNVLLYDGENFTFSIWAPTISDLERK